MDFDIKLEGIIFNGHFLQYFGELDDKTVKKFWPKYFLPINNSFPGSLSTCPCGRTFL